MQINVANEASKYRVDIASRCVIHVPLLRPCLVGRKERERERALRQIRARN